MNNSRIRFRVPGFEPLSGGSGVGARSENPAAWVSAVMAFEAMRRRFYGR